MGHTVKRCKQPIKEEEGAAAGAQENLGFGTTDTATGGGGGGWDNGTGAPGGSAHNDWETSTPAPVAVGGGW